MPFTGSLPFLHSDLLVFGTASTPGVLWRNGSTGKLQVLDLGTAQSGKLLGVSATGLLELQSPATFSLADKAVTYAKFQDIPTATLLGRSTAGAGSVEALTAAQGRTLLGLGSAATVNTGTAAGEIPLLATGGVLPAAMIPALRSHEFVEVANQAARLALTTTQVQIGDECLQTDQGETYKLVAADPTLSASWRLIADQTLAASAIVSGVFAPDRLGANGGAAKILSYEGWIAPVAGKDPLTTVTANGALSANTRVHVNGSTTRLTQSLPTTAAAGDEVDLTDVAGFGWRITQAAGQRIYLPDGSSTTVGTGGYLQNPLGDNVTAPNSKFANAVIRCTGANTWLLLRASAPLEWV